MTESLLAGDLSDDQRESLNIIRSSGSALVEIINDILDFSKLDAGRLELLEEPLPIDDLVFEIAGLVNRGLDRPRVTILVDIAPEVPPVLVADAKRTRQILHNVVGNAYKFTETGQVRISLDYNGQQLTTRVEDTGVGMPPDMLSSIFEAFSQVDNTKMRRFDGTGLGLAITKGLVEAMSGTISVASEPGKGSCFTISLPVSESSPDTFAPLLAGRKILLMGLKKDCANYWQGRLERLGAEVSQVADEQLPDFEGPEAGTATDIVLPDTPFEDQMSEVFRKDHLFCHILSAQKTTTATTVWLDPHCVNNVLASKFKPEVTEEVLQSDTNGLGQLDLKVLAAEDNKTNRLVLKKLLANTGLALNFCVNGQEAVDQLCCAHNYDAVLMDISMPILGGIDATEQIRAWEHKNGAHPLPIIALTANVGLEDQKIYRSAGMTDFVPKPYRKKDLLDALQRHAGAANSPKAAE
jgi:CheY-like chemotaxis protein